MTILEVKQDERPELKYVFVVTLEPIPLDTIVELNGQEAVSCILQPPIQNSIGFSYMDTDWVFGQPFTLKNSQETQVVSDYTN